MKEDFIGLDVPALTKWFEGHLPGTKPPLDFHLITGGHSNLTYKVSDRSGNVYILRRPPIKQLSKYAHDVRREFRVMLALARSRVPVPPVAGFCPDPAVTGAHFYVMKFVPGTPIHDRKAAEQHLDEQGRLNAAHQLIDAMVELHAIDPDSVPVGHDSRPVRGNRSPQDRKEPLMVIPGSSETGHVPAHLMTPEGVKAVMALSLSDPEDVN